MSDEKAMTGGCIVLIALALLTATVWIIDNRIDRNEARIEALEKRTAPEANDDLGD